MHLLPLATLALLLPPPGGELELPESLAARAWASVGPQTQPVDLEAKLFAAESWLLDPESADPEHVWGRWAEWLGAEGQKEAIDPRRRAGLIVLAVHQSRWEDAWAHFGRLGAAPEWAAAIAPLLVPGVPIEHLTAATDPTRGLPDGVLLRPAVPPRQADDPTTSLRPRAASVRGLRIGTASVDLRVSIEPSGLEVDLWHRSGETAKVHVLLPEPPGQEIRVEYIDWMRQDALRAPLILKLVPGDEEHNLFGRFRPRREPMPALPRALLPRNLTLGGLLFVLPLEQAADPRLLSMARPVARAVGRLLGISSTVLPAGAPAPESPWNGTRVQLAPGPAGHTELVGLLSLCERYVLSAGQDR
jgi:hypothetical protein